MRQASGEHEEEEAGRARARAVAAGLVQRARRVLRAVPGALPGGEQAAAAAMRRAQQRMCVGAHEAKGCAPENAGQIKLISPEGPIYWFFSQ